MVLAGLALHLVSTPNAILIPALVAGLRRVLILQRPGIVKMPFFLTSVVARVANLPFLYARNHIMEYYGQLDAQIRKCAGCPGAS